LNQQQSIDLIQSCLQGDQKSQLAFYDQYYRLIYNTCRRIVNDDHLAEDMMQETFIKAFRSLKSFDQETPLIPWLKRIAINQCVDELKKRRIEVFPDTEIEVADDSEIEIDSQIGIDHIKKAMRLLSGGYQMILSLYLLEGYDHEEIGQILGIKSSTSRSQYMRAKKRLAGLITEKSYV